MLLHTMRDLLLRRHIRSMLRHILIRFQIHLVGGELPHKLTRGIRELDVLDTDFDDIETEPCRPRTRILPIIRHLDRNIVRLRRQLRDSVLR